MPDEPTPRVARKALKFTGDVAAGKHLPGFMAHDLTQEQAEVWLTDAQYEEMIQSDFYEEVDESDAEAAVDANRLKRRRAATKKKEGE